MYKCKIVSVDWQLTAEGETVLQHFYDPQTAGRKLFGLLEKPNLPPNIEELSFKIFVTGKAGIGKTTTIARLAGTVCPSCAYVETVGIRETNVYWPTKIRDKVVLFKLQIWDAGENSIKKYSHILPACIEKADAVLFIFSFTDHASFVEIPQQMGKIMKMAENPTSLAIGTRYNPAACELEVDATEVLEFEQRWRTPVLRIDNAQPCEGEVHEVAPLLNLICERLWLRAHSPPARPTSTIRST